MDIGYVPHLLNQDGEDMLYVHRCSEHNQVSHLFHEREPTAPQNNQWEPEIKEVYHKKGTIYNLSRREKTQGYFFRRETNTTTLLSSKNGENKTAICTHKSMLYYGNVVINIDTKHAYPITFDIFCPPIKGMSWFIL